MPILTKAADNEIHRTILAMIGPLPCSIALERGGNFGKDAATYPGGNAVLLASLESLIQARGPEAALQQVLQTLQTNFLTTLDMMATLVCVVDPDSEIS